MSSASLIRELQVAVNQRGYALVVDGNYGPNTHAATMASLVPATTPAPPPATGPVPESWMPAAKMSRIVFHWTAGTYTANSTDMQHYHVLIQGDGTLKRGPSITLNESPLKTGYAAHTKNCNTGSIGVSVCSMAGAVESPFNAGKYPLTKLQWDTLVAVLRQLGARYAIPATPTTILSHAEVQANLGIAQSGKWDIAILPFDQSFNTAKKVGDRMRNEI